MMNSFLVFCGILMAILYAISMIFAAPVAQSFMASFSATLGILGGILIFPTVKTLIETFDGSLPFFERLCYSYRNKTL